MLELTVKKCPACEMIIDDLFPQANCALSRCPGSTVERVVAIKDKQPRVAKPRKTIVGRKLNADQVREIRRLVALGHARKAIARQFCVSPATVGEIMHRITWMDLPEEKAEAA
jgi:DNA-binding NarL/FixJ family response regulator